MLSALCLRHSKASPRSWLESLATSSSSSSERDATRVGWVRLSRACCPVTAHALPCGAATWTCPLRRRVPCARTSSAASGCRWRSLARTTSSASSGEPPRPPTANPRAATGPPTAARLVPRASRRPPLPTAPVTLRVPVRCAGPRCARGASPSGTRTSTSACGTPSW